MTTTLTAPRATEGAPRDLRRIAGWTGALFLVTYVTSIPAKFAFYAPMFDAPHYVLSDGADGRLLWGAVAELLLVVANIGSAIVIFPVLKRFSQSGALAFVAARVMESVFIGVGVLSVLTLVTIRQDAAAAGPAARSAMAPVGDALVALQDWTFDLGPNLVVGVGNGLVLGYLMYRTGLVPRRMAMLGLLGGTGIVLGGLANVLGLIEVGGPVHTLAAMPEFFWELSLGLYLLVKGFRRSPFLTAIETTSTEVK